jgi:hypothetical protein
VINALLGALAIQLEIKPDLEAARRMEHRWQKRQERQVREPARVSQAILECCRPLVLSEVARKGWQTRKRQARSNGHA